MAGTNPVIKKIIHLADTGDPTTKIAAIRILGELKVKDTAVLKRLGEKLSTEGEPVKLAILDAYISNPQPASLRYLVPMLKQDGNIRRKAIRGIGSIGPKAISFLEKEFRSASLQEKKLFVDIFASIRSKASIDFLMRALREGDLELAKYVCFALRTQMERMAKREKLYLLAEVSRFLALKEVRTNDEKTTSGIVLLGYVGEPRTKKTLLRFFDRKHSFYVRRNALLSLSRLRLQGAGHEDVVEKVFPLLKDPDYPNVVRNALEIFGTVSLTKRHLVQIPKLLDTARHPAVKQFALKQLAALRSREAVKLLIAHLDSNDPMVRDAAAGSLGGLRTAVPELIRKVETTRDAEKAEKLALILRTHRDYFKKEKAAALYKKLERALIKAPDEARVYALTLKHVNPDFFYAQTLKGARQAKRSRKWELAKRYLEMLASGLFYTDEVRCELAGVLLKLSKRDISPQSRNADPALQLYTAMARLNFSELLNGVRKDRSLDADDLYYLGFHFAERQFEQKAFGAEVLKHLLKKYPRSKLRASARKKLELAGPVTSSKQAPAFSVF